MNPKAFWALIVTLLVIGILHALSFRYRMHPLQTELVPSMYVIDNWTGRMWQCHRYSGISANCDAVR